MTSAVDRAVRAARARSPRFPSLAAAVPTPQQPQLIERIFDEGLYPSLDQLAWALHNAWRRVEVPGRDVSQEKWKSMWRTVGYVYGAERREDLRPTEPVTMYRGAPPEFRDRLSWTSSPERAHWYIHTWRQAAQNNERGRIWQCTIPPERFLAHFDGRGELEWLVEVDGLAVIEHGVAKGP